MNRLFILSLIISIAACTQQTKTTVVKDTDSTSVKETVKATVADTAKMNYSTSLDAHANDTIVPGKSVGHISIGEKTDDVITALNQPDSSDAAMGKAILSWYSKPTKKGADTVVNSIKIFTTTNMGAKDEASRVKQIRITSPFFKTAELVGCGSTIAFIKMQYPQIKKPNSSYTGHSGNEVMVYEDSKSGIAFEIGSNTKCVGITIHKPGDKAREIYVAEFGDLSDE